MSGACDDKVPIHASLRNERDRHAVSLSTADRAPERDIRESFEVLSVERA